jgi:ATP/maltotriose-dependent transcriptional regulator MalT
LEGEAIEAQGAYGRSVALYRDIGDRGGLAEALHGSGRAAYAAGAYQQARDCLHEALRIAADMQFTPLVLAIMVGACEIVLHSGSSDYGVETLAFTVRHPTSERETRDRAQRLLQRYEAQLAPEAFAAATQRGHTGDLDATVASLLAVLLAPLPSAAAGVSSGGSSGQPRDHDRVNLLTEREHTILVLIAEGLSNQEIADRLILSLGTVKWYTGQIYSKLGVQTRTQAVAHARVLHLLP